jgi:nucleoside-diphosphate-sugar epimerase
MNILITGGTGFIGKRLVDKLDFGKNKLLVITRNPEKVKYSKRITPLKADLVKISKSKEAIKFFEPDAALHLAWEGIPDYGTDISIKNFNSTLSLINLLTDIKCKKIVATGSLWEYGSNKGKVSEDAPIKPFNAFTAAKHSINILGEQICKDKGVTFVWTRIFYVYGPGQRHGSLIPYLISCAKKNLQPEIRNPDASNDFVYVDDVADAIIRLLDKQVPAGTYNIGSGKLTKVSHIIKKINSYFGKSDYYKQVKKNTEDSIYSLYADLKKINKASGWRPSKTIDEGIKETIESMNQ